MTLPEPTKPVANYVPCKRLGNTLYSSGHGPQGRRAKIGDGGLTIEEGVAAARSTALAILASVKAELGSLDHVRNVVKVLVMVNGAPGFNQTPKIADGASEVFVTAFGEGGRHARSAVGMGELPFDIPVEIEAIFEVD